MWPAVVAEWFYLAATAATAATAAALLSSLIFWWYQIKYQFNDFHSMLLQDLKHLIQSFTRL